MPSDAPTSVEESQLSALQMERDGSGNFEADGTNNASDAIVMFKSPWYATFMVTLLGLYVTFN